MLKAMISAYRSYAEYKKTCYELTRLTDRELWDLGIDRSNIEHIARDSTHKKADTIINNMFANPFSKNTETKRIEVYLADSADLVDLENRLKNIERGLTPWQVISRRYTQIWV